MNSYYNTTNQQNPYLQELVDRCEKQEVIVMEIFKKYKKLTASEVYNYYPSNSVPITSIRRAITNILKLGNIVKTSETKIGLYGSPEHYYLIKNYDDRQLAFF